MRGRYLLEIRYPPIASHLVVTAFVTAFLLLRQVGRW